MCVKFLPVFLMLCGSSAIIFPVSAQQTQIQYLSGTDKNHTIPWQFYMTGGGRSNNVSTTIPVPSCWQTKGFGSYSYGNTSGNGTAVNSMSIGQYSTVFSVPASWAGDRIFLVYEGVLTDTATVINGQTIAGSVTNITIIPATTNANALPNDRAFDDTAASSQGGTGGIAGSPSGNVNLGTLSQFTFTGWIKPQADFSTMGSTSFPRIMMVGATPGYDTSTPNGAAFLGYAQGGVTAALQFTVNNGSVNTPSGALTGNDWVFVAVTYDSTLAGSNVKFYIGNKTTTPTLFSTQTLLAGPVAFGTTAYAYLLNRVTLDRAFDGWGDDFRIFNSVLNQSSLELVRSNALSTAAPPATVAQYQWDFDGTTTGTTVTPALGGGGVLNFTNTAGAAANLYSAVGFGVSGGNSVATTNTIVTTTAHQGGFYEFNYDVTTNVVVAASTNTLNVTVKEWSDNLSVNQAEREGDFWDFSGIFRPVYLKAVPMAHIDRLAVNPQASGQITINAYLGGISNNYTLNAFVTDKNNVQLGSAFSSPVSTGANNVQLSASLPAPNPWSAEFPNLYTLTVQLLDTNNVVIHTVTNLIGFRTIMFSNGVGYLVNGKKLVLRGICRHEFWPTDGRTTSLAESDLDIALIKDMNFNAVRMTHYPPNKIFLDECDRLGLYVFDELTGWAQAYDNTVASNLVTEMVIRDVNHPSIIAWDNGNEGGWNTTVDNNGSTSTNVYAIWDPQNRHVNRPRSTFNNVVDDHYDSYSTFAGNLGAGKTAYSCTEELHGLFDGGAGASLSDYWDLMRTSTNGIGMFLWAFLDEGVVRNDLTGNPIDVQDQAAPDGVVGPYRQPEASYYVYKATYNPVQVTPPNPASFNGTLAVENRFSFTSLNQCTFDWQLGWFPDANDPTNTFSTNALTGGFLVALDSGDFAGPNVIPGTTGSIVLPEFPVNETNFDALRLTATDPFGNNLYIWTWPLHTPIQIRNRIVGVSSTGAPSIFVVTNTAEIIITNGPRVFHFSSTTGVINSLTISNQTISLSNGPRPVAGVAWTVAGVTNYFDGTNYYVGVNSLGSTTNAFLWTLRPDGWLKLNYQYWLTGSQNFMGVTFDYPSNNVTGISWLGQGPYRDYKNRQVGQEIFVHTKATNYTSTGRSILQQPNTTPWVYPEFAGYYGQLNWATLQTTEQPITVITPTTNLFFRVLTPPDPGNANVVAAYPSGVISLLHGISPMGEKFHSASSYGPSAALNVATGLYTGEASFFFGALPPLPAVPEGLTATAGAAKVNLSWNGVAGATGYNLKSSTVNGGSYTIIANNLKNLTFTNTGLLNGITYYYVVTAVNANGESKSSPQVTATTLILSPVFNTIAPSGSSFTFSGTNGTPGRSYVVLLATNLIQPVASWTVLATNTFDSVGGFNFTNPPSPSAPQQFYILKLPTQNP